MPDLIKEAPKKIELMRTSITCAESPDGLPKIMIKANSGEPMNVRGYYIPVVVDMEGVSFAKDSIPILMDHDSTLRIGHTTKNTLLKKEIKFEGVASSTMGVARGFVNDSKNGFPFQASIGADVIGDVEYVEDGAKATVNGKTHKGPLYIARKTSIYEVSVTVFGADSNTESVAASKKGTTMNPFEKWLSELGFEASRLSDDQTAKLRAKYDAEVKASATPPAPKPPVKADKTDDEKTLEASRKKAADEAKRIDSINTITASSRFEEVKVDSLKIDGVTSLSDLKAHAIENGWSADKLELTLHRAEKPKKVEAFNVHTVNQPENINEVLECAVFQNHPGILASGKTVGRKLGIESMYDEKTLEQADKHYRGLTLHRLMDMQLQAAGIHFDGSRKSNAYIRATQEACRRLEATGYTTVTFTNLLENVQNKSLMAAYNSVETVWPQLCAVRNLNDFKPHAFYRLEMTGAFKQVAPTGELKHVGLTDSKETVTADTYGMILALNRQMIINDDLDSFMQLGQQIGRLAGIRVEELVFVTLLSNPGSFFHANNGNLKTGAGSDLTIAGLTLAEQTFDDMVDSNGKPIGIGPDRIFHGTQDTVVASRLFNQTQIETTTTADTPTFTNNPHAGKFTPYKARYLNNTNITDSDGAAITGQDANQWYIATNPEQLAGMRIGFLNGVRQPTVEQDDMAFNTLGFQWRSYFDFGVAMGNTKAIVKMAGT